MQPQPPSLTANRLTALSQPVSARPRSDREGPHVATANAHPDLGALSGGLAYITGGASGIGYGLAQEALAHGLVRC